MTDTSSRFNYLGYTLITVGYMTLTISLPLVSRIAASFDTSSAHIQAAVGLLFLMFSLSAIALSTLSDLFGAAKILKLAQVLSIAGLLLLSLSQGLISYTLGCLLMGLGTGCYSSISRALMTRHSSNELMLKKAYSYVSICVVISPILAAYLGGYLALWDWRIAYSVMAALEILVFVYAYVVLKADTQVTHEKSFKSIYSNFSSCLKIPNYTINLISIGVCFAIFLRILLGNTYNYYVSHLGLDFNYYNIILFGMSFIYITGIFLYRSLAKHDQLPSVRYYFIAILVLGAVFLSLAHNSLIFGTIGIYLICFALGALAPLFTGATMAPIKRGYGTASAMITFSFSAASSFWSFLESHLRLSAWAFTVMGTWISIALLLLLALSLLWLRIKNRTDL